MRNFFEPTAAPSWLRQVLSSIRAALGDVWPVPLRLKDYATADLPVAADFVQGLAWNATVSRVTYSDGSAWSQLQPYDATLAALAALDAAAGMLVQTGADTFTKRTLTGTANQIAVANGDGVSGAPTISLPSAITAPGTVTATGYIATTKSASVSDVEYRVGNDANTGIYSGGAEQVNFAINGAQSYDMAAASHTWRTSGTIRLALSATVLDMVGQMRCDSLRIDVTPTAETPVPTHTVPISLNGTVYRIPCVI